MAVELLYSPTLFFTANVHPLQLLFCNLGRYSEAEIQALLLKREIYMKKIIAAMIAGLTMHNAVAGIKSCDLDIDSTEITVSKMLTENIGVFSPVNINRARAALETTCETLGVQYTSKDTSVTCQCIDFYAEPPANAFQSAEHYAHFVCQKKLSSKQYKEALCNRLLRCISTANPNEDTRWLEKKSNALRCGE